MGRYGDNNGHDSTSNDNRSNSKAFKLDSELLSHNLRAWQPTTLTPGASQTRDARLGDIAQANLRNRLTDIKHVVVILSISNWL
jgi:hypothetical protein